MQRQLGLITTAQASAWISEPTITRRVQTNVWERVLPGVYRDTLVPTSLPQRCLAAQLWAKHDPVISFVAAGTLYELDGLAAKKPELWTPKVASARSDLVVVHRGTVDPNDRRMLGPIRVTGPARTIVDLAGVLDDEDLTPSSKTRSTAASRPPCRSGAASTGSAARVVRGPRASGTSSTTAAISARRCRGSS